MASKTESSFGAKLQRGNDMHQYISNFPNFAPPRPEESPSEFYNLLGDITMVNMEETMLQQQYSTAVATRVKAFRDDPFSVVKLLAPIRAQVQAQYGKDGIEFKQVDAIVQRMRKTKLSIRPATADTPAIKVSQSEQSYGSMLQYFSDLTQVLLQLPGYNPSNPQLQVGQLQAFAQQLVQLSAEVASRYQMVRDCRNRRRARYDELHDRAQRIKAYVKANYGTKSQEYALIKGLLI